MTERIRRARMDQIKLEAGCLDCGFREHPAALVFSHVRGGNWRQVSLLYNCSWARVLEEIAKCDVACANCHSVRHARTLRARFEGHQHAPGSTGYLTQRADIAQVKLSAGCADCGYREHSEALQFDHDGSTKLAGIGRMTGSARRTLDAEIAKCIVRCANCHAIRTAEQAGWRQLAAGSWEMTDTDTREWALAKAREIGLADESVLAAVVTSVLRLPMLG